MNRACRFLQFIHYADDTTAFITGESIENIESTVAIELQSLCIWLQSPLIRFDLTLNFYHGNSNMSQAFNLSISDQPLSYPSSAKFLGMTTDDKTNFKEHVNDLAKRLCKMSGLVW